jgi:acetyl-CoA C-acetyltransferase
MRSVAIIGIGQTAVSEHWGSGLRELGAEAALAALKDANLATVDAVYTANAYGACVSEQTQLGALLADYAGLRGAEAYNIEAADASGGAALRAGYLAVVSGVVNTVLVIGVEKMSDAIASARVRQRSTGLDTDYELAHGATLTAMAGLLMRRYMHEYDVELSAFEGFSVNAHLNGSRNPNAMFRNKLRGGAFGKAPMVATPVNLFDNAPDGDGAAAVVLTSRERAMDMVPHPIQIVGSAVATDTLALQDRNDMLYLNAVAASTEKALAMAGVAHGDIDLFELHDAFTILSTLTLEAAGFAPRGQGWILAENDGQRIGLNGELPLSTFGGLKSRGNPVGATGVYQAVEATLQLREAAEDSQVGQASTALIQNIGGLGTTVVSHVLQA